MFKSKNQLPGNHVLSFRDVTKEKGLFFVTDDDLKSSGIIFGPNAQDRESLVVSPILDRLIELGHSGLVIDSSGASVSRAMGMHKANSVLIGVSETAYPVNLLDAVSATGLRSVLKTLVPQGGEGTGAVSDAVLAYHYLQQTIPGGPSLADLYEALIAPVKTVEGIDHYLKTSRLTPADFAAEVAISLLDPSGLMNVGFSSFSESSSKADPDRLRPLLNALRPFWSDHQIRNKLCVSAKPAPLRKIIVERRKTIFLDMPFSIYGDAGALVARILFRGLQEMVLSLAGASRPAAQGGQAWKSFLVLDDCTQSLSVDDLGWFSMSSAVGHMNIMGCPSLSALHRQLGSQSAQALLANVQTKVILPTDDDLTLAILRKHDHDPVMLLDPQSASSCFVYKGCFPAIRGEYTLESAEPANLVLPAQSLAVSERVNERFVPMMDQWHVVGGQDGLAIRVLVDQIKARIPKSIQNAEALMRRVVSTPLPGLPGTDSIKEALLQIFANPVGVQHLILVISEQDGAFAQSLNLPQVAKAIEALVRNGHLKSLNLVVYNSKTNPLILSRVSPAQEPGALAARIAQSLITGEPQ